MINMDLLFLAILLCFQAILIAITHSIQYFIRVL